MKSKTIIISSQDKNKAGRGILTLYDEDDILKCKLRLYGVEKLNRYAKIGIYHNNEVYTANLLDKGGVYFSSFVGNFNMDSDFYTAIIKTDNNNEVLLAGGTYAGFYFNDNTVFTDNSGFDAKQEADEYVELDKETQELIDKESNLTNEDLCDKCASCKYKEYFYSHQDEELYSPTELESTPEEDLQKEDIENKTNFNDRATITQSNETETKKTEENPTQKEKAISIMEQIVPQFKYIFENYPPNEELNKLIENSKFVEMSEGNYSIGAIYMQEEIKYICYAVRCRYNTPPPEELGKHHQWLPIDQEDPLSEGYYMVFQDATDLKIIEL